MTFIINLILQFSFKYNILKIKRLDFPIIFLIFLILSNTTEFILNRSVILLLLRHKQYQIMSQHVLSLKNVTIYQEAITIYTEGNLEVNHGEFLYII